MLLCHLNCSHGVVWYGMAWYGMVTIDKKFTHRNLDSNLGVHSGGGVVRCLRRNMGGTQKDNETEESR